MKPTVAKKDRGETRERETFKDKKKVRLRQKKMTSLLKREEEEEEEEISRIRK